MCRNLNWHADILYFVHHLSQTFLNLLISIKHKAQLRLMGMLLVLQVLVLPTHSTITGAVMMQFGDLI